MSRRSRPRGRFVVLVTLPLLALPPALPAQEPGAGAAGTVARSVPTAPDCPYDECALRLWEGDVLEGSAGERVARFGFLRPPALRDRFAASDSATRHLRVVEANYTRGRLVRLTAQVASLAGLLLYFSPDTGTQRWGFGLQSAGFAIGWLGQRRVDRAEEALSRAIWWYNRDVAAGSHRTGQTDGGGRTAAGRR